MYQRYRKDVEFFVVYIGEAHPSDAWQVPSNIKDRVVYASPTTENERSSLAGVCVTRLGIKLPALVDGLDDATEKAYAGWPDRLYLVGSETHCLQDQAGSVRFQTSRSRGGDTETGARCGR
jgi:type I thyroxine 5'-deiodinase